MSSNLNEHSKSEKKGLHPLAWVGIGCAGLAVLGAILLAVGGAFLFNKARQFGQEMQENPALLTAKIVAAADPEIELVANDEENRTVTFRNLSTGEHLTVSYQDIEEGKLTFSGKDGSASIALDAEAEGQPRLTVTTEEGVTSFQAGAGVESLPDWVPVYPGTRPKGTFSAHSVEARAGAYSASSDAELDVVMSYYARQLEEEGLSIVSRTTTGEGAMLMAATEDDARQATIILSLESDIVRIVVQYTEKES